MFSSYFCSVTRETLQSTTAWEQTCVNVSDMKNSGYDL